MSRKGLIVIALMAEMIAGCSTVVSSNAIAQPAAAWNGPVLVSESSVPPSVNYKVLGSVQADARAGYDRVPALYPLLATEAKKMGANAVVSAKGGHHVTAFSWASPYVSGIAIRVDDLQNLKGIPGAYY